MRVDKPHRRALVALALAAALPASTAFAAPCESLVSLQLPHTKITSAQSVPAGPYTSPVACGNRCAKGPLPAFCRVTAAINAAPDSLNNIEIWLPDTSWNGRLQAIGNHGWGGELYYVDMGEALKRGFATVGTDSGHAAPADPEDASWMTGHPQRLIDFAYRGIHEMTIGAKGIIAAYYSQPAKYAYFHACSSGGRQALLEAIRYPDDYDGIIAGSASANRMASATQALYGTSQLHKDGPTGASFLSSAQITLVNQAVVKACDSLDGVQDGLISYPPACRWNPTDLVCKPGQDASTCINPSQAKALDTIYAPMRDPQTRQLIMMGQERGSEFDWLKFNYPKGRASFGLVNYRYVVFNDPKWDGAALDLHTDYPMLKELGGFTDAVDPNLDAFKKRGGKLIQYHGWGDSQFGPAWTVHYYNMVLDRSGQDSDAKRIASTQDFYRLMMMPGLGHCTGGPGPNTIGGLQQPTPPAYDPDHDVVSALQQWVEKGIAPQQIIATKYVDDDPRKGIKMQRPICPFPALAVYDGKGDPNAASSFSCQGDQRYDPWAQAAVPDGLSH